MDRPVWTHAKNLAAAIHACGDARAVMVAFRVLATYAPEGVGAFVFDPAAFAALASNRREAITAADIEAMRGDLLRFFLVLPDGRWAPSPALFVANDPYAEGSDA